MENYIIDYGDEPIITATSAIKSDAASVEPKGSTANLSDREVEVLRFIGLGATNREIAEKLIISEHTVKSHLRSILNKLNIRNRQQAAVYAEREGLISAADVLKTEDQST